MTLYETETDTHEEDAAAGTADYIREDAARYAEINATEIANHKAHLAKMGSNPNYAQRFNDGFCAVAGGNLSDYEAMTARGE